MSTEFTLNTFAFGDAAGNGEWLVGHFRNHLQYNAKLSAGANPIVLPEFPILTVEGGKIGRRSWLEQHANWHQLLRPFANVTGIDLAEVDMTMRGIFTPGWTRTIRNMPC